MKLKEFNLEEALAKPEKVVYRNGQKPKEWHWFEHSGDNYPIITIEQNGDMDTHTIDGSYDIDGLNKEYDLMLLPEVKEYWVNVYRCNGVIMVGIICDSKELAASQVDANKQYLGTILIHTE